MQRAIDLVQKRIDRCNAQLDELHSLLADLNEIEGTEYLREPYDLPGYAEQGIIPEREWERRAEEAERGDVATAKQRQHDAEEMKRKAQAYRDGHAEATSAPWVKTGYCEGETSPILDMTTEGRTKRPWPLGGN